MISIVIPAHNEEKRIFPTLVDYCETFPEDEVIISLNACTDDTKLIIQEFQKLYPNLKYIESDIPAKGQAIINGFRVAKSDFIGFADADNATGADEFLRLAKILQENKELSGVIASRYMPESIVEPRQSWKRTAVSRIFNAFVNVMLGLGYKDTQCGCKIFRRDAITKVLPDLATNKWGFDVDLLYQLKKRKVFKVQETGIVWKDKDYSKVNILKAGPNMILAVIRLRLLYSPLKFIVDIYDKIK